MILDIIYRELPPEQIQRVRTTTVYVTYSVNASPEIVIHFYDGGQRNISLNKILTISTSND